MKADFYTVRDLDRDANAGRENGIPWPNDKQQEEIPMRQGPLAIPAAVPGAHGLLAGESRLSRPQVKMLAIAMMGGALEYYEFIVSRKFRVKAARPSKGQPTAPHAMRRALWRFR